MDLSIGKGFATGKICLGEIEVVKITEFEKIWSCSSLSRKANAVTFYKPVGIPDGYSSLGHYCQPSDRKLRGYVLVAKCISSDESQGSKSVSPALTKPLNYTLVWSSNSHGNEYGYIWLPNPPEGYKPTGFVVTTSLKSQILKKFMHSSALRPTVYFHPDEAFLPSSVSWFFENGALLYKDGKDKGLAIDSKGSNLPGGGRNDGRFWLDLPVDNNGSDL
ncbi:UNVERIFIED_CONTAM: hypothetical protein Sradi_6518500 [Sesamum radiatum]|uniref:Uncharacterized protein n=1 Tax=Sesamum radiatum TaxID=300843 RepID=A0AAW2JW34_SESRA